MDVLQRAPGSPSASTAGACGSARSRTSRPVAGARAPTCASPAIPTWCRPATRPPGPAAPSRPRSRRASSTGRGAVDMKGAILAAFVAAAAAGKADHPGSLSLLITGDEEGPAIYGTGKVVQALMRRGRGRRPLRRLGEPTSARALGDQIKVGRRGSPERDVHRHRQAGARGLSGPGGQPHRAPGAPARPAAGAWAGRGLSALPALEPRDHHHRRGQSGDQRDPGQRQRPAQASRFNPHHDGALPWRPGWRRSSAWPRSASRATWR